MKTDFNLNRFLEAQESTYHKALAEIKNGQKESHWMWFIFPQIAGLGYTDFNIFYAIKNIEEALAYYNHPILGKRLIEISEAMHHVQNKTALEILGKPDTHKLKSCMTLFLNLPYAASVFQQVLDKYYDSELDEKTLAILKTQNH